MTTKKIYLEGFQLTVGPGGLLIEAIDYHARPLFLDERELGELGLRLRQDWPDRLPIQRKLTFPTTP